MGSATVASNRDIDEEREVNPLKDIIYNKKNSSNISNISNMLERKNFSIYMYSNIWKAFSRYSNFTGKKLAVCVEAAIIEYMRNHPVDQVTLNVTKDMNSFLPTLKSRMKHKIIKKQLEDQLNVTIRLHQIGNDYEIRNHYPAFQKAVEKALRVKKPDEDLLNILRKCEDYL